MSRLESMMDELHQLERNDMRAAVAFHRKWKPLPPDAGEMLIMLFDDPEPLFRALAKKTKGE